MTDPKDKRIQELITEIILLRAEQHFNDCLSDVLGYISDNYENLKLDEALSIVKNEAKKLDSYKEGIVLCTEVYFDGDEGESMYQYFEREIKSWSRRAKEKVEHLFLSELVCEETEGESND